MRLISHILVTLIWLSIGCSENKNNTQLEVMNSGGFTAAYQILSSEFIGESKIELNTVYGASMGGAPSSIPQRLSRHEPADVVILASQGLEKLIAEGKVIASSRIDLATSRIGMAVRSGDSKPDISSIESFKRVLLNANSIAYSASASGTYLSTELFQRLEIVNKLTS